MPDFNFVYNDDGTQALTHARLGRVKDDLHGWVDDIIQSPVDAWVQTVAFPDVCYHNTTVGERYGSRANQLFDTPNRWARSKALQELKQKNQDFLKIVCDRVHRHNKIVLAGVRMSDAQHRFGEGFPSDPMFPTFTHEHPEFRLQNADGSLDVALDYTYQEVRDHRLAIIREIVMDYPVDGLELDFMRFCAHFPHPASSKQVRLMTTFIAEVRQIMDEAVETRGLAERLILGARVPPTLAECKPNGLAPAAWARDGLVDYIAPADFLWTDMNLPLDDYQQVLRSTKCKIFFTTQPTTANSHEADTLPFHKAFSVELPEFRAHAANAYATNAHGNYAFNWCSEMPGRAEELNQAIAEMSDKAVWRAGSRHYQFFPTQRRNTVTGAKPTGQVVSISEDNFDDTHIYSFQFADGGRRATLNGLLSWRIFGSCLTDNWNFRLNGQMLAEEDVRCMFRPGGYPIRVGAELPSHMYFEVDLAGLPLRFRNQLEVIPVSFELGYPAERRLEVLEVWVYN